MIRLALLLLFCAASLPAQGIAITAEVGFGGQVLSPATEARIGILKTEAAPFVGRIVLDFSQLDRGGTIAFERRIVQDIHLEEGHVQRAVRITIPANLAARDGVVRLERRTSVGVFEPAAQAHVDIPMRGAYGGQRKLAGYVSGARLQLAGQWFFHELVEISPAELPESWKPLAGFDLIILNDDRLTRAQAAALVDYVAMGGTLLISPTSAATFNPETPAGALLGIAPTTRPASHSLGDFSALFERLAEAGASPELTGIATLPIPSADDPFALWPERGNAKPASVAPRLVSRMPVGAGMVVLLHANISEAPFHSDRPSSAGVNLLLLGIKAAEDSSGASPLRLMATTDIRNRLDIASRRIPNRDVLVLVLLVYIGVAGVGMFLLARRIRRPELYPAALLAAAVASVVLVFGVGELAKRGGNRVQVARLLVSDGVSENAALFTAGCSYAVEGKGLTYRHAPSAMFLPSGAGLRQHPSMRVGDDSLAINTLVAPSEVSTELSGLQRWQNIFFLHNAPQTQRENRLRVDSLDGAWRVTNLSPHRLRACVFLVGRTDDENRRCDWYFAPALDAEGDTATFSSSTRIKGDRDAAALATMMAASASAREFDIYADLLNIHPKDRISGQVQLERVEALLLSAALLPAEGEYLMLSLLPPDALPPSDIGAGIEDSRIGRVNLWAVRGMLDGR